MEGQQLQIAAGTAASLLFIFSNLSMLFKALKTKDLKSYSPAMIILYNVGNLVYWVYVASLPFGPVWFLHGFYTVVSAVMLFCYWRYEKGGVLAALFDRLSGLWDQGDRLDLRFYGPEQSEAWKVCTCTIPCICSVHCACT